MTRATKHVTFHLTANSHRELSREAKLAQLGIGQYVSQIVIEYLRNKRKETRDSKIEVATEEQEVECEDILPTLSPEELKHFRKNILPYLHEDQQRRNETIEAMFSNSGPTIKSGSYDVFKVTRDFVEKPKQEESNG